MGFARRCSASPGRRKRKRGGFDVGVVSMSRKEGLVRTHTIMLVGGLVIALVAALLLFLGVIESGPAALVGIVGIGLIAGSVPLRNARS